MYEQAITDALAKIGFTRMDDWSDVSGCPVPIKGKILRFYKPNTKEAVQVYVGPIDDENLFDDDFRNDVFRRWPRLHEATIEIPEEKVAEIQAFLDSKGNRTDKVEYLYTAEFDDGMEADIKVCDSDEPSPFIDPVLFDNGQEVMCLDVRDELLGEYVFEVGFDTYRVIIKKT